MSTWPRIYSTHPFATGCSTTDPTELFGLGTESLAQHGAPRQALDDDLFHRAICEAYWNNIDGRRAVLAQYFAYSTLKSLGCVS